MKKHLPFCCLILLSIQSLSAQEQPSPQSFPLSFEASYTGDGLGNFTGGIKKGASYLGMAQLGFTFDTEKSNLWKGGLLHVSGTNAHGGTPSETLIGDFQVVSNIEAGNMTFVQELWYSQQIDHFSTAIGLQDLSSVFAASEAASLYLNSSFGIHSTIASNIPSPIFPVTAFGWQIGYELTDQAIVNIAIFDGMPEGTDQETYNLAWHLNPEDGFQIFAEYSLSDPLKGFHGGHYKVGAYLHRHYEPDDPTEASDRNYGFYLVADQTLFKQTNSRTLTGFLQASVSPGTQNDNNNYLGLGLNITRLFSNHSDDVLGLAIARAGFRNQSYSSETTLELTYQLPLADFIYIQPDIQYVIHPSGTNENLDNALVGILRVGLSF